MRYIPDIMRDEIDEGAPMRLEQVDSLDMLLWPVIEYHAVAGNQGGSRPLYFLVEHPKGGMWCHLTIESVVSGRAKYNLCRSTSVDTLCECADAPFAKSWRDDSRHAIMRSKIDADDAVSSSCVKLAEYGVGNSTARAEVYERCGTMLVAATEDNGYLARTRSVMAEGAGTKTPALTELGKKLLFECIGSMKAPVAESWSELGAVTGSVSIGVGRGALLTWQLASALFKPEWPCGKMVAVKAYDDGMTMLFRSPGGILTGYKFRKKEQARRGRYRYGGGGSNGYALQRIYSGALDSLLIEPERIQWAPFMDQDRIDDTLGRIRAATVAVALGVAQKL